MPSGACICAVLAESLQQMYRAPWLDTVSTTCGSGWVRRRPARELCPKSPNGALLCATSVFSVSLWLMKSEQKYTHRDTENTEVAQRNLRKCYAPTRYRRVLTVREFGSSLRVNK